jgi:hypothetical protein
MVEEGDREYVRAMRQALKCEAQALRELERAEFADRGMIARREDDELEWTSLDLVVLAEGQHSTKLRRVKWLGEALPQPGQPGPEWSRPVDTYGTSPQ